MKDKSIPQLIKKLFKLLTSREVIAYIIAGVLTTVVNIVSFEALCRMGIQSLISNVIAWVIAVVFAYVVNKINVFQSKSDSVKDEAAKLIKFFSARLLTLGIEEFGLLLFNEILGFNRLIVKAGLAVIVIILNYVFSKLFIFTRKSQTSH